MNTNSSWGRKETIVWPPHAPIFLISAILFGIVVTGAIIVAHILGWMTFPQRVFVSAFVESSVKQKFQRNGTYRLLFVSGVKKPARLALPDDFDEGTTTFPNGSTVPTILSQAAIHQGYNIFYTGQQKPYGNEALSKWLSSVYFGNRNPAGVFSSNLIEGLACFLFALPFAVNADVRRYKQLKYGRLLRGPVMLTPKEFNTRLEGGGLGITTREKGAVLRIPRSAEPKHIQIMGDTGAGKSTLIKQILQQIADRGESAIINDPSGEFTRAFYRKDRGDYLLNPLDARAPYWSPASELKTPAEARTIATSLYQPTENKKGEFFIQTPQKIFAHLLKYRPTSEQLVEWMSNPAEIDVRIRGTELAAMIDPSAPDQRQGVLGSLGLIADCLRLLPTKEQAEGREWSATAWAEDRKGWIFFTSTEAELEGLRPLQSLWIDLLILRLMTEPKPGRRRAWFIIDELASLQRLPQFHTALTKGRKSDNPIVFGYQGKAQLEEIYGHLAEVMLSMPATKFILRTSEPKAAKWASELIGDIEIERLRETVADGKRSGKSFTLDRQTEALVMPSEIEGMDDLRAYIKLGNYVSGFAFPHMRFPEIAPSQIARRIPEDSMWFNPLAPVQLVQDDPAHVVAAKITTPGTSNEVVSEITLPVAQRTGATTGQAATAAALEQQQLERVLYNDQGEIDPQSTPLAITVDAQKPVMHSQPDAVVNQESTAMAPLPRVADADALALSLKDTLTSLLPNRIHEGGETPC